MKSKLHPILRIIAGILVMTFLAQDIVWAYPDKLQVPLTDELRKIKPEFGKRYRDTAAKERSNTKLPGNPINLAQIKDADSLSNYIDNLEKNNYALLLDPDMYENRFLRPLFELFLIRLKEDFSDTGNFIGYCKKLLYEKSAYELRLMMNSEDPSLISRFKNLSKNTDTKDVSIGFYGVLLFYLTTNFNQTYLHHIYRELMRDHPREEIAIVRKDVSYRTRADSVVHIYPKNMLFEGPEAVYRKSIIPRADETPPDDVRGLAGANDTKIIEAVKIWKRHVAAYSYSEIKRKALEKRIENFEKFSTVLELREMKTQFLFSDPDHNMGRLIHVGRSRRVLYGSKRHIDSLNKDDEKDMRWLAFWLDRFQHFIDTHDEMVANGYSTEEIQKVLSEFNMRFFEMEDTHLLDQDSIRGKLAALMEEDTLTKYSGVLASAIHEEAEADIILKSVERYRKSIDVAQIGKAKEMYHHLLYRYEGLGLHSKAVRAYDNMAFAISAVQSYDKGYYPLFCQMDLIFAALGFQFWQDVKKELATFLTGKKYSRLITSAEVDLSKMLISPSSPDHNSFEDDLRHSLSAQKAAASPETRPGIVKVERVVDRLLKRHFAGPFRTLRPIDIDNYTDNNGANGTNPPLGKYLRLEKLRDVAVGTAIVATLFAKHYTLAAIVVGIIFGIMLFGEMRGENIWYPRQATSYRPEMIKRVPRGQRKPLPKNIPYAIEPQFNTKIFVNDHHLHKTYQELCKRVDKLKNENTDQARAALSEKNPNLLVRLYKTYQELYKSVDKLKSGLNKYNLDNKVECFNENNGQMRVVLAGASLNEPILKNMERMLNEMKSKPQDRSIEIMISFDMVDWAYRNWTKNPVETFFGLTESGGLYLDRLDDAGLNYRVYGTDGKILYQNLFDNSSKIRVVVRLFNERRDLLEYAKETKVFSVNPNEVFKDPTTLKVPYWGGELYEFRNENGDLRVEFKLPDTPYADVSVPLYDREHGQILIAHVEKGNDQDIVKDDFLMFRAYTASTSLLIDKVLAQQGLSAARLLRFKDQYARPVPLPVPIIDPAHEDLNASTLIGMIKLAAGTSNSLFFFGNQLPKGRFSIWTFVPDRKDPERIKAIAQPLVLPDEREYHPIIFNRSERSGSLPDFCGYDKKGKVMFESEIGRHSVTETAEKFVGGILIRKQIGPAKLGTTAGMPGRLILYSDELYGEERWPLTSKEQLTALKDAAESFTEKYSRPKTDKGNVRNVLSKVQDVVSRMVDSYESQGG